MASSGNFFKVSRKGYDVAAVDAFVAAKAQEEAERADLVAALEARVGQLNSQVEVLGEEAGRVSDLQSELGSLRAANAAQQERIAELEMQVSGVKEQEEALKLTLASATRTRDELIAAAEQELERARTVAKEDADRILAEAQAKADTLTVEAARRSADTNAEAETILATARAKADDIDGEVARATSDAAAEAARITADARAAAEQTAVNARAEAAKIVEDARADGSRITDEARRSAGTIEAELADRRAELEALRATYTSMAGRLEAILAGGIDALTEGADTIAARLEAAPEPSLGAVRELRPTQKPETPARAAEPPAVSPVAEVVELSPKTAPELRDDPAEAIHEPRVPAAAAADDAAAAETPAVETPAVEHDVPAAEAPVIEAAVPAFDAPTVDAPPPSLAAALKLAAAGQSEILDDSATAAAVGNTDAAFDGETASETAIDTTPVAAEEPEADAPAAEAPVVEPDLEETIEDDAPAEEPAVEEPAAETDEEAGDGDVDLDDEFWNPPAKTEERGSFYSRRSGRLPRLGADASRGAMSAALGMRIGHEED